ncbi:hypothetical protein BpHYR1_011942 [Brachionus plicatilis]|uniref:Uncharacterized protein n=1 Tax=Brachionus plicatilis TaxID=10195 RepID=A0A3M7SZZ3_BRAPC|nr:hypothetical protein BpHYR1_011942 [Brachionus plicatilis]
MPFRLCGDAYLLLMFMCCTLLRIVLFSNLKLGFRAPPTTIAGTGDVHEELLDKVLFEPDFFLDAQSIWLISFDLGDWMVMNLLWSMDESVLDEEVDRIECLNDLASDKSMCLLDRVAVAGVGQRGVGAVLLVYHGEQRASRIEARRCSAQVVTRLAIEQRVDKLGNAGLVVHVLDQFARLVVGHIGRIGSRFGREDSKFSILFDLESVGFGGCSGCALGLLSNGHDDFVNNCSPKDVIKGIMTTM